MIISAPCMLLQMAWFHSSSWLSSVPLCPWTTSSWCIHLLMGYFPVSAIVNVAAVNTGMHRSGIAGSHGNSSFRGFFWFSRSVMSDSLRPHGLQHARLPYPSPTPRACSDSCPLSQWCYPTISSSVSPFSSCLQSFPASGSFPMSQFFASGGQSIGASASASVLSMNIQDWFPLGRPVGASVIMVLQMRGLKPRDVN